MNTGVKKITYSVGIITYVEYTWVENGVSKVYRVSKPLAKRVVKEAFFEIDNNIAMIKEARYKNKFKEIFGGI
jgi:hypothetical protein